MVAARHRLGQHRRPGSSEKSKLTLWQDTLNSTAAMSPGGTAALTRVHQGDELRGREPAQRDDHPLVPGARVVVAQVGVDADVAPAEGVQPAAVGAAQHRAGSGAAAPGSSAGR